VYLYLLSSAGMHIYKCRILASGRTQYK